MFKDLTKIDIRVTRHDEMQEKPEINKDTFYSINENSIKWIRTITNESPFG